MLNHLVNINDKQAVADFLSRSTLKNIAASNIRIVEPVFISKQWQMDLNSFSDFVETGSHIYYIGKANAATSATAATYFKMFVGAGTETIAANYGSLSANVGEKTLVFQNVVDSGDAYQMYFSFIGYRIILDDKFGNNLTDIYANEDLATS